MRVVALSAGHSLSDPGAVYSPGAKEAFMTMELTRHTADILRKHSIGVLTVPDVLTLVQTIAWINARAKEQKIDLCVEIHTNASTDALANGVEAWYYHDFSTGKPSEQSKNLSQCLIDAIGIESGLRVKGIYSESQNRWGRLGFVHDTDPIASLVECGFLSNEKDRNLLLSETGRRNVAKGIARGILTYMGEAWKPELINNNEATEIAEDAKSKTIETLKKSLSASEKRRMYELAEAKVKCQEMHQELGKLIEKIDGYMQ